MDTQCLRIGLVAPAKYPWIPAETGQALAQLSADVTAHGQALAALRQDVAQYGSTLDVAGADFAQLAQARQVLNARLWQWLQGTLALASRRAVLAQELVTAAGAERKVREAELAERETRLRDAVRQAGGDAATIDTSKDAGCQALARTIAGLKGFPQLVLMAPVRQALSRLVTYCEKALRTALCDGLPQVPEDGEL